MEEPGDSPIRAQTFRSEAAPNAIRLLRDTSIETFSQDKRAPLSVPEPASRWGGADKTRAGERQERSSSL